MYACISLVFINKKPSFLNLETRVMRSGLSLHPKVYFNLIVFFAFEKLKSHILHLSSSNTYIYPSTHQHIYLPINSLKVFNKP